MSEESERRADRARVASVAATIALALGGALGARHASTIGGDVAREIAIGIVATIAMLALGGARAPEIDRARDVRFAIARVAIAALVLAVGVEEAPLDFTVLSRALAGFARASALVLSVASVALTVSEATIARILRERGTAIERALLALGAVAAIALSARALAIARAEPLAPDALVFREIATRPFTGLFETAWREPLHVWILRVAFALFGASDDVVRATTIALAAVALAVYYAVTRALFGRLFAALAFFLFAISTHEARMSVLGLRNEEVTIALCVFIFFARRARADRRSFGAPIAAGVAAGLASLVYISLLVPTELFLLFTLARARAGAARIALALAPAIALVVPCFVHNARELGDPLYTVNMHAVFYRNQEFAGRAGYPTRDEIERAPYSGPKTTPLRYMLVEHAPLDAAEIAARGAARLATFRAPAFDAYRPHEVGFVVWIACALGAALSLRARRFFVPLFIALGSLPIVFVTGAWAPIEPRLTDQLLFAWLWLVAAIFLTPPPRGG